MPGVLILLTSEMMSPFVWLLEPSSCTADKHEDEDTELAALVCSTPTTYTLLGYPYDKYIV